MVEKNYSQSQQGQGESNHIDTGGNNTNGVNSIEVETTFVVSEKFNNAPSSLLQGTADNAQSKGGDKTQNPNDSAANNPQGKNSQNALQQGKDKGKNKGKEGKAQEENKNVNVSSRSQSGSASAASKDGGGNKPSVGKRPGGTPIASAGGMVPPSLAGGNVSPSRGQTVPSTAETKPHSGDNSNGENARQTQPEPHNKSDNNPQADTNKPNSANNSNNPQKGNGDNKGNKGKNDEVKRPNVEPNRNGSANNKNPNPELGDGKNKNREKDKSPQKDTQKENINSADKNNGNAGKGGNVVPEDKNKGDKNKAPSKKDKGGKDKKRGDNKNQRAVPNRKRAIDRALNGKRAGLQNRIQGAKYKLSPRRNFNVARQKGAAHMAKNAARVKRLALRIGRRVKMIALGIKALLLNPLFWFGLLAVVAIGSVCVLTVGGMHFFGSQGSCESLRDPKKVEECIRTKGESTETDKEKDQKLDLNVTTGNSGNSGKTGGGDFDAVSADGIPGYEGNVLTPDKYVLPPNNNPGVMAKHAMDMCTDPGGTVRRTKSATPAQRAKASLFFAVSRVASPVDTRWTRASCSCYVGVAVKASGLDPDSPICHTMPMFDYYSHSPRWTIVHVNSKADLRPGDVAVNREEHTFLIGADGGTCQASLDDYFCKCDGNLGSISRVANGKVYDWVRGGRQYTVFRRTTAP